MNDFVDLHDCKRTRYELWYGWKKGSRMIMLDESIHNEHDAQLKIAELQEAYNAEIFNLMHIEETRKMVWKGQTKDEKRCGENRD